MDPLTLALIAGGATAVSNIPNLVKTDLEKEQERRLKALRRREELGTLGLTAAERSAIDAQFTGQQAQVAAGQQAQMGQYGALQAQPGQAALGMVAAGDAQRRLAAQQAQAVTSADLNKSEREKQDILDLSAAQSEAKQQRLEAVVAPLAAGAQTFIGAETMASLMGQGVSPQDAAAVVNASTSVAGGTASQQRGAQVGQYMTQYGLSFEEAKRLFGENDERDDFYMGLQ